MSPDQSSHPDIDSDPSDRFFRWFCTGLVLVAAFLAWKIVNLLTEAAKTVQREQLLNGTYSLLSLVLISVAAVIVMTLAIRGFIAFFGLTLTGAFRRMQLRSARRRAEKAIDRKQQLIEERIRMAARLRATWLFERECYRLANVQARREFREALQSGVTRSCEISFKQIGQAIDQYESVVEEIGASSLGDDDKAELLNRLTEQLSVAATEKKAQSAEKLMEEQIWNLRIETADKLSMTDPAAALRYLREVVSSTEPGPGRRRTQALLRRLEKRTPASRATPKHA